MDTNPSAEAHKPASDTISPHNNGTTAILGGTFTSYYTTNIVNVNPGGSAYTWQQLSQHVANSAIHTSEAVERQDMCLEGTRKTVLEALGAFLVASSTDTPPVLWMNGPAGAGKSAIMRTVARTPAPNVVVLASFFFFRTDNTRNSHHPLIPTIAFQMIRNLAKFVPGIRTHVESSIDEDPTIFTQSNERQARTLIIDALLAAAKAHPTSIPNEASFAILIDGLDECRGDDHQLEVIDTLVNIVAQVNRQAHLPVKLIIASRPEPHIDGVLSDMGENGAITILKLDKSFNPDADIKLFYDVHFARIRRTHPLSRILRLGPDWPSVEVKFILARKASGQFAFPDTIIKFTRDPRGHPVERLQMVLDNTSADDATQPFAALDHLYHTIFSAMPSHLLPLALRAVGALLAPEPMGALCGSARCLASFLRIPLDRVQHVFLFLSSLFRWTVYPDAEMAEFHEISEYHASLADFVFSRSRSEKFGLFIDHSTFAQATLHYIFSSFTSFDDGFWNDGCDLSDGWHRFAWRIGGFRPYAKATPESIIEELVAINPANTTPTSLVYLTELDFHIRRTVDFTPRPLCELPGYLAFETELRAQHRRRTCTYLDSEAGRLSMALLFRTNHKDFSEHILIKRPRTRVAIASHIGAHLVRCICARLQSEDPRNVDETAGWNMFDPQHAIYKWMVPSLNSQDSKPSSHRTAPYLQALGGLQKDDLVGVCQYLLNANTQRTMASDALLQELNSHIARFSPKLPETPIDASSMAYLSCMTVRDWISAEEVPKTGTAFSAIWSSAVVVLDKYPDDGRYLELLRTLFRFAKEIPSLDGHQVLLGDLRERLARSKRLAGNDLHEEEIGVEDSEEEDDHWEDAEEGDAEIWD